MPKLKTKKTLVNRIKITKSGKLLKRANNIAHLNSKLSTNKRHRKSGLEEITAKGYIKKLKNLLPKVKG